MVARVALRTRILDWALQRHAGGAEVIGNGRDTVDPLASAWMSKSQFPGMEHLSRKSRRFAVDCVSEEWMPKMFEVYSDLMGAAGVQGALHECTYG